MKSRPPSGSLKQHGVHTVKSYHYAGLDLTACLDYLEPYPRLGLFQASQDWSSFGRIVRPLELYDDLPYQFSSPERSSQSSGRSS